MEEDSEPDRTKHTLVIIGRRSLVHLRRRLTLLGLVAIGAVELHTWNSTVDDLEHPDLMVLDLDPGPGVGTSFVVETAFALRSLLKTEGYESWPKLTGGKGIHVMVPLADRAMSHDEARDYSRRLANQLARGQPDRLTTSSALSARDGRLFIDYLRNGRGTTAVATYSPRARLGFPIAAPTTWEALVRGAVPDTYTLARPGPTAPRRPVRASRQRRSPAADVVTTSPLARADRRPAKRAPRRRSQGN